MTDSGRTHRGHLMNVVYFAWNSPYRFPRVKTWFFENSKTGKKTCFGDFADYSASTDATRFLKKEMDRKLDEESKSFFKIVLPSISVGISLLKVKNWLKIDFLGPGYFYKFSSRSITVIGRVLIFLLQAQDPLGSMQKIFYRNRICSADLAGVQSQVSAFSGGYIRSFHHFPSDGFRFTKWTIEIPTQLEILNRMNSSGAL